MVVQLVYRGDLSIHRVPELCSLISKMQKDGILQDLGEREKIAVAAEPNTQRDIQVHTGRGNTRGISTKQSTTGHHGGIKISPPKENLVLILVQANFGSCNLIGGQGLILVPNRVKE
jgi:hypothetical protein